MRPWLFGILIACTPAPAPIPQPTTRYELERESGPFDATVEIVAAIGGDSAARTELRSWLTGDDEVLRLSACEALPDAALSPLVDPELLKGTRLREAEALWKRSRNLGDRAQALLAEAVLAREDRSAYAWDAATYLCERGDTLRCGAAESLADARCDRNTRLLGLGFGLGSDRAVAVVCPDSRAERAGLKKGDVIERIGPYATATLRDEEEMQSLFLIHRELTIRRDGAQQILSIR